MTTASEEIDAEQLALQIEEYMITTIEADLSSPENCRTKNHKSSYRSVQINDDTDGNDYFIESVYTGQDSTDQYQFEIYLSRVNEEDTREGGIIFKVNDAYADWNDFTVLWTSFKAALTNLTTTIQTDLGL